MHLDILTLISPPYLAHDYLAPSPSPHLASSLPRPLQLRNPPLHLLHPSQPQLELLLLVLEPQPPLRIQRAEEIPALAVELQDPAVVAPQAAAVGDGHERHAERFRRVVHGAFDLERDGRGALVQDGVAGRVVEEAGHGDALLKARREGRGPLVLGVPAARARGEVPDADGVEPTGKVRVRDAPGAHLPQGVRVRDLLAQRPAREIGPLRDVEDGRVRRFADGAAAVDGPEAAEDAEEGGFAAAVGADDEEVRPRAHAEGEGGDERVAVRGDDGHGGEFDRVAFDDGASAFEEGYV